MSRFNLGTIFFLVTFAAFMMAAFRLLPEFTRLPTSYSTFALYWVLGVRNTRCHYSSFY